MFRLVVNAFRTEKRKTIKDWLLEITLKLIVRFFMGNFGISLFLHNITIYFFTYTILERIYRRKNLKITYYSYYY